MTSGANRALQIFKTNVIGDAGLHFQSKARNLPINGETLGSLTLLETTSLRQISEDGADLNCEVTGTHSWIDVQNLVVEGLCDGEVLMWAH